MPALDDVAAERDRLGGLDIPSFLSGWDFEVAAQQAADHHQLHGRIEPNWLSILLGRTLEAAARRQPSQLRKALVQVAGVALAWIESLDRKGT